MEANFSTAPPSPFEWLFSQPLSYNGSSSGSRMFFDAALGKVSGRESERERADNEQFAFETSLFTYGFGKTKVSF